MPHTKLKVFSVLYIIAGAFCLLAALCVVIATVVAGEEFTRLLAAENMSETMVKLLLAYTVVMYLAMGCTELFAGISGIRFAGGSIDEKFCRIPAVILMALNGLSLFLKIISWSLGGLLGTLFWLIIAVAYFSNVKKVEEYNKSRPSIDDMALFNLKDI